MSVLLPARGPLTDALLATITPILNDANIQVGDGTKPQAGGWPEQPGSGDFVGYVTVATGRATEVPGERPSLASEHSAWLMNYTLTSVGAVRQQADYTADLARAAALQVQALDVLTLGPETWGVVSVLFHTLAPIDKDNQTDPPTWQAVDACEIRISRATKRSV